MARMARNGDDYEDPIERSYSKRGIVVYHFGSFAGMAWTTDPKVAYGWGGARGSKERWQATLRGQVVDFRDLSHKGQQLAARATGAGGDNYQSLKRYMREHYPRVTAIDMRAGAYTSEKEIIVLDHGALKDVLDLSSFKKAPPVRRYTANKRRKSRRW